MVCEEPGQETLHVHSLHVKCHDSTASHQCMKAAPNNQAYSIWCHHDQITRPSQSLLENTDSQKMHLRCLWPDAGGT